jgi:hypothetical protein
MCVHIYDYAYAALATRRMHMHVHMHIHTAPRRAARSQEGGAERGARRPINKREPEGRDRDQGRAASRQQRPPEAPEARSHSFHSRRPLWHRL